MFSPSALLLVVVQTLIIWLRPLRFAGCVRLQQSTSQRLCTEMIDNMQKVMKNNEGFQVNDNLEKSEII